MTFLTRTEIMRFRRLIESYKPYADPAVAKAQKKLEWLESGEHGEIERKFGAAKRHYTLDCIVTKLQETSETLIHSIVLFMNLRKKLRLLLRSFFRWLYSLLWSGSEFPISAML